MGKLAKLGAFLGEEPGNESSDTGGEALCRLLWAWTEKLELPTLSQYGVEASDVDRIVAKTRNRHNPIALTPAEIKHLVRSRL